MNHGINGGNAPGRRSGATLLLIVLLLSSLVPVGLELPVTKTHDAPPMSWPQSGSNDTGWVLLETTGADPSHGLPATANLNLLAAPGAQISNLTFEVGVNGSDGVWLDQPNLYAVDTSYSFLNWNGLGGFGAQEAFIGSDPHNGRLQPSSDVGARYNIPAEAEVTDLILEALAPVDPMVSFTPLTLSITSQAQHPDDGRLYLAISNKGIIQMDANSDPSVIHIEEDIEVLDLFIDEQNDRLLASLDSGEVLAWDLADGTPLTSLPSPPTAAPFTQLFANGSNTFGISEDGLFELTIDGSSWLLRKSAGSNNWPAGEPLDCMEIDSILYVAINGGGVARWDSLSASALSLWNTANQLPSDRVGMLAESNGHLLIGTLDGGIARYDLHSGGWLATWNNGNWLASNDVKGIIPTVGWTVILVGETVQFYDTNLMAFTSSHTFSSLNLFGEGEGLVGWLSGGMRAPAADQVLVNDGTGKLAVLEPTSSNPQVDDILLASGPSGESMSSVVEYDGKVWVGVDNKVDRFEPALSQWFDPIVFSSEVTSLTTDGAQVFIATDSEGIFAYDTTGNEIQNWTSADGLLEGEVSKVVWDSIGNRLVASHPNRGLSIIELTNGTVESTVEDLFDGTNGGGTIRDFAVYQQVVLVAIPGEGVVRYDIPTSTYLPSWTSTGMDDVGYAPIIVSGNTLYIGLYGYGVVRQNRTSGEFLEPWQYFSRNDGIPSDYVTSLEIDGNGHVWVGTIYGAARWDGNQWDRISSGGGGPGNSYAFYDLDSDSTYLYGATSQGACRWQLSSLQQNPDCWDYYDGLPAFSQRSVKLQGNLLYAGSTSGAGIIDLVNETVIDTWEAGVWTQNAPTIVIDDIAYIGFYDIGLVRFNLSTGDWLTVWDGLNGPLGETQITALEQDRDQARLWVGGSFGLKLLDIVNETLISHFPKSTTTGSISMPGGDPAELIIHDNILYMSEDYWESDEISRIDLDNQSSLSALDAGSRAGLSGTVYLYGMGLVGGVIHAGVASPYWWASNPGAIVRWDTANGTWATTWEAGSTVEEVYAKEVGGDLYIAYGEEGVRHIASNGTVMNEWTHLSMPIKGIVEYDGLVMFATQDGIARYDAGNDTWQSTWTSGSGYPSGVGDYVMAIEVIGADLWVSTTSWSWSSDILWLEGSTGSWDTKATNTGGAPRGIPVDFEECAGIVHVAISHNRDGGVARWDPTANNGAGDWLTEWEQGNPGLPDNDANTLACDSSSTIYIGFYQRNVGVARYDYGANSWRPTLTPANSGIAPDRVWDGSMEWNSGVLAIGHAMAANNDNGGLSMLHVNGAHKGNGFVLDQGSEVSSLNTHSNGWLLGRPGGSSGFSRAEILGQNGLSTTDSHISLSSGKVVEFIGNLTHTWVVMSDGTNLGEGILEGLNQPNGDIEWTMGWSSSGTAIEEVLLDETSIWISTAGDGVAKLNLTTRNITNAPLGLHQQTDGLALVGDKLVIGLMGTGSTAPGVEILNTTTFTWEDGRLLSGLPSNVVNDFLTLGNHVYIATDGGLGRYNLSRGDWDDPLTVVDGLPNPVVDELWGNGNELWLATPVGLQRYDITTQSLLPIINSQDGLIGDGVRAIATHGQGPSMEVYLSHDGSGPARPGATSIDTSGNVLRIYNIDQIPSNNVRSITSDWWGVHLACDADPLTHWNGTSSQFESGATFWEINGWPPHTLSSDGSSLLAITNRGVTVIEATTPNHSPFAILGVTELNSGYISSNGVWLVGSGGLYGYGPAPGFVEVEREYMRRAVPMSLSFLDKTVQVGNNTHPGRIFKLIGDGDSFIARNESASSGPGGIWIRQPPVTISSPNEGAATWLSTVRLNYTGAWNLTNDPMTEVEFQRALNQGALIPEGRELELRLESPRNGSMWVRIAYDWERIQEPVDMVMLKDRPNDGGGALDAHWGYSTDPNFAAYRIYLKEGGWTQPFTGGEFDSISPDLRVPNWAVDEGVVILSEGTPLQDGLEYWAVVLIEYNDGSLSPPSEPFGPATPTDEVPPPPEWAVAGPSEDGSPGDLEVEWRRCTGLDVVSTHIYTSTTMIDSPLLLNNPSANIPGVLDNKTTLHLTSGIPWWLALTCVDAAGQEDLANATIVGPVVPTGGIDDGVPPPRIEGVEAFDTPNDEGGSITVKWTPSDEEDCSFHSIYILKADGDTPPDEVTTFSREKVIPECAPPDATAEELENTTHITTITSANTLPLFNGHTYWVAVVASDVWLNEDLGNVHIRRATPEINLLDSTPPPRVVNLTAWDHPNDEGGALDVSWEASDVSDFAFYTIWAAEVSIENLTDHINNCPVDLGECGGIVVKQQHGFDEDERMEITLSHALLGDSLENSTFVPIVTDMLLSVTVTIHDLAGNVFTDELPVAWGMSLDNRDDITPPPRIEQLSLSDRPDDAGDALELNFQPSNASDLDHYEVYADTIDFSAVGQRSPILILSRTTGQPILIDHLANDIPLNPGQPVVVAVVAVDSSGNAIREGLVTVSATPVDDSQGDPGGHLPPLDGIGAKWILGGSAIEITWTPSTDTSVQSYLIFIANHTYRTTSDATLAVEGLQGSSWVLTEVEEGTYFDNESHYWVTVVASDGAVHRHSMTPVHLLPYEADTPGGGGNVSDEDTGLGAEWLANLNTSHLITALLVAAILTVFVMMLKNRRKLKHSPVAGWDSMVWDDAPAVAWESASNSPPSPPPGMAEEWESSLLPAASAIDAPTQPPQPSPFAPPSSQGFVEEQPTVDLTSPDSGDLMAALGEATTPTQPVPPNHLASSQQQPTQPVPPNHLASSQQQPTKPASDVDTSFLDDLL